MEESNKLPHPDTDKLETHPDRPINIDELIESIERLSLKSKDYIVKDHVNSPPLESPHFPTFGRERLDDFGLNFFRYDSPSMTK
jgi:hypothetical protein